MIDKTGTEDRPRDPLYTGKVPPDDPTDTFEDIDIGEEKKATSQGGAGTGSDPGGGG